MRDPHRQGPHGRIPPTLVLLSLLILQACVTYKPIPFSRIDEPVLGSDTVSSVQFGGVYHGSPLLFDDGTTSDWGIDAFYDSKWRLSQRFYLHQRADLVVSQFDKLGLVPYGYAASLGVEGGVPVTDQLAFEGGL